MRAVVQRVAGAKVDVDGVTVGRVEQGLLVYLGVGKDDGEADAQFIADKVVNLRIFADDQRKLNLSVKDVGGGILLISNFTLHGDCRKGRRPSFEAAGEASSAEALYGRVAELILQADVPIETGVFGGYMQVSSTNDGPVTLLIDSKKVF